MRSPRQILPWPPHQEILGRLVLALRLWARNTGRTATIGQGPEDFRFGSGRILQPDAYVCLTPLPLDVAGPIDQVPDLCIEVLSRDRVYDRVTKRLIHAEAGVKEYWVVEHADSVERWSGAGLRQAEEVRGRLVSPLLPGFALEVGELFTG